MEKPPIPEPAGHLGYTALFRQIAERHIDFQHSDTEMHFGWIIMSDDPFQKSDLDEFTESFRDRIRFPLLLLVSYAAKYTDNGADNIRKQPYGSFIVLDAGEAGNYDLRDQILHRTEELGEEIVSFLRFHFANQVRPPRKFNASSVITEKIGPVGDHFYGTKFDFELPLLANKSFQFNPSKFSG